MLPQNVSFEHNFISSEKNPVLIETDDGTEFVNKNFCQFLCKNLIRDLLQNPVF